MTESSAVSQQCTVTDITKLVFRVLLKVTVKQAFHLASGEDAQAIMAVSGDGMEEREWPDGWNALPFLAAGDFHG